MRKIFQEVNFTGKEVVLLIDKTSAYFFGERIVKQFTLIVIFLSASVFGCSFTPMQKAGTDALLEAHCLYEKKFNYKKGWQKSYC